MALSRLCRPGIADLQAAHRRPVLVQPGPRGQAGTAGLLQAHVGVGREAVGEHADAFAASHVGQGTRPLVVGAGDQQAAGQDAAGEAPVGVLHRRERAVEVEVVGLDVGDDRDLGPVDQERAVALVRLGDEHVTGAVVGVGAVLGQLAADGEGRVGAAGLQRHGQHRRRRGLAVRAGDGDPAPSPASGRPGPGCGAAPAAPRSRARASSTLDSRMAEEMTTVSTASTWDGVVPDVHDGALGRQRPQHEGVLGVGPGDGRPPGQHDPRDAGHAGAADGDEVHPAQRRRVRWGRAEVEAGDRGAHRGAFRVRAAVRTMSASRSSASRSPTPADAAAMACSRSPSASRGSRVASTQGGVHLGVVDQDSPAGGDDVGRVDPLLAVADRQRDVDRRQADGGQLADGVGAGPGRPRGRPPRRRGPSGRRTAARRTAGRTRRRAGSNSLPRPLTCSTCTPAARRASTRSAKVVLSRWAPSDPPVTSRVGRVSDSPKWASASSPAGGPVEQGDLPPQRHPDDGGVGQRRGRERRRHVARHPGTQPVGQAGAGVLLVHDDRDPAPARGEVGRGRDVAAEADDDLGAGFVDRRAGREDGAAHRRGQPGQVGRGAARERPPWGSCAACSRGPAPAAARARSRCRAR